MSLSQRPNTSIIFGVILLTHAHAHTEGKALFGGGNKLEWDNNCLNKIVQTIEKSAILKESVISQMM